MKVWISKRVLEIKPRGAKRSKRTTRYLVRWIDPTSGRERTKTCADREGARALADQLRIELRAGDRVSLDASKITFAEYVQRWIAVQNHRASTAEQLERNLRLHILPVLGDKLMRDIVASDIKGLRKRALERVAPGTVVLLNRWVGTIFRAAVEDEIIRKSPMPPLRLSESAKMGPARQRELVPLSLDEVRVIAERFPARWAAAVWLAAGSGMRQGEILGTTVGQIDFLRRQITVDRQLVTLNDGIVVSPPKSDASIRTIPLADLTLRSLAAHIAAHVETDETGRPKQDALLFTTAQGGPIRRQRFADQWRIAAEPLKCDKGTGFHALRHFYASLLIRQGLSVRAVQARLGHKTAEETLRTYAHLWPDDDESTRAAVQAVLSESRTESRKSS